LLAFPPVMLPQINHNFSLSAFSFTAGILPERQSF
jgi:hypothetical protein